MNRILLSSIFLLLSGYLFSQNFQLKDNIRIITNGKNATIGVAAIFEGKDTLVINNQYRYPTMSVYKFHQALAVLDHLNKNNLPLDTKIHVDKSDLLPNTHSPLRDKNPAGNFDISISELLKYSVTFSDNNACDILFKYLGGTDVVDKYIKGLGITDTSITATEEKMHETPEDQYLNWTSPLASVELLEMFLKKNILPATHSDFLKKLMVETTTGKDKIKYLLPEDVVVGHKTGSSFRTEFGFKVAENDIAFVTLPNGKQYTIAIFIMNSKEDDKTNSSLIAGISRIVYDHYKSK